jgi:ribonucleases P/MRP protein subunit RPP40
LEIAPVPDPLEKLFAIGFTSVPSVSPDIQTQSPSLTVPPEVLANGDRPELEYLGTEWYEWLSLVRLGSPRVQPSDNIDPYLSRYQAPEGWTGETKLCKVSWQGFISPDNARKILADIIINAPSKSWFSFSATAFSTGASGSSDEVTVLRPADAETGEYMMWEVRNSNS